MRSVSFGGALLLALCSTSTWALGLGELEVRSRLNQPLEASIGILDAGADELESLQVRLASADVYSQAGLDRAEYLNAVQLAVVGSGGSSRIQLSSEELAREPVLNLYVEARWGEGRLLREYSVLLDPPESAMASPRPANALPPPIVAAAAPAPQSKPVAPRAPSNDEFFETADEASRRDSDPALLDRFGSSESQGAATAAAQMPKTGSVPVSAPSNAGALPARYGPIKHGETLWRVAYNLRPDDTVSMDQMQVALYRANPKAFGDGRITGLLAGVMLDVPSLSSIRAVDAAGAKSMLDAARRGAVPAAPPAPPVAPTPQLRSVTPLESDPEPELQKLPEPEASRPAPAVSGEATGDRRPGSALEELQRQGAAQDEDQTDAPRDDSYGATGAASAVLDSADPDTESTAPDEPMVDDAPPAPVRSAPVIGREGKKRGLPWLWIGLLVVVLVLIASVLMLRRREDNDEAPPVAAPAPRPPAPPRASTPAMPPVAAPVIIAPPGDPQPSEDGADTDRLGSLEDSLLASADVATPGADRELPSIEDSLFEDEGFDKTVQMPAMDAAAARRDSNGVDFDVTSQFEAETMRIDLDSNDPLSEADFHIAYGLYDEAALLLRQAAENAPERTDIRVKLAETYFAANKPVEFLEVTEGLREELDAAQWQNIGIMGRQLTPDAAMFADDGQGDASLLDSPVDFELEAAPETPDALAPMSMDLTLDEISFDEAQDVSGASADIGVAAAPERARQESLDEADNGMLDFSLEDFELDGEQAEPPPIEVAEPLSADSDAAADAEPADRDPSLVTEPAQLDTHALDFDLSDFDLDPASSETLPDAQTAYPSSSLSSAQSFSDFDSQSSDSPQEPTFPELDLQSFDAPSADTMPDAEATEESIESFSESFDAPIEPGFDAPLDSDIDPPDAAPAVGSTFESEPPLEDTGEFSIQEFDDIELDLDGGDEAATRLDLAKAYVDIGDADMARTLLQEVADLGSPEQQQQARDLLSRLA
ncbi:FimV/HubP family polar landmark protein [Algiphilus sp. W345]|uniref:FimV/HubP family polar landmark protein n=1 Tax=Banduia mediterranea TaxID=3075609 RepID=A0ABU2WMX7_9GAMM|nr:FimV/HubP family polar landmark protein [Algiphilus sp. W345]MDT0498913.1 FimV/HubP family polar landmark protein [Algiphilus sp. W345]